ncbi:hypothetical protein KC19_2G149100, partial [Ceratodon purpureus]
MLALNLLSPKTRGNSWHHLNPNSPPKPPGKVRRRSADSASASISSNTKTKSKQTEVSKAGALNERPRGATR